MKKIVGVLAFVFIPMIAAAQDPGAAGREEMQNPMQLMQEMQACMEKVDKGELDALEKRSDEVNAEIDRLCIQGKRDEAQKKAMAYSKELSENRALQQMKQCSEKMVSMMPEGEKSFMEDPDFSKSHVCDEPDEE
ncbi:MAG: hypothetical protein ACYDBT_16760 [Desulfobulbaceae bacterium]